MDFSCDLCQCVARLWGIHPPFPASTVLSTEEPKTNKKTSDNRGLDTYGGAGGHRPRVRQFILLVYPTGIVSLLSPCEVFRNGHMNGQAVHPGNPKS